MDFMKQLENTANHSVTENGAVGYRTSGSPFVDATFKISTYRNKSEVEIIEDFLKMYEEDSILALKWLFYVRDIREGVGERKLFRTIVSYLANNDADEFSKLVGLIPEYGRWDDLFELFDSPLENQMMTFCATTLCEDKARMKKGKSTSLLAKWMPSENASSNETKVRARKFMKHFEMNARAYRRMLVNLRRYIDIVERKMSANNWSSIDYSKVPSKANLIYSNAFFRHDNERRAEFFKQLERGETKINASTLFPHDIVHRYRNKDGYWGIGRLIDVDTTLEELWKSQLKDFNLNNTLIIRDGSGSMTVNISKNDGVTALDVADALTLYFTSSCRGGFKDKFITFSSHPQLVDVSKFDTLHDKLDYLSEFNDCTNTNIEKTFDLILSTALNSNMKQEDMPERILIVSDMEFDAATYSSYSWEYTKSEYKIKLFDEIKQKFEKQGYKLPKLVFWNVNSRTSTIPVKENELGVSLVSGFSKNVINMVMQDELNPFNALLNVLNSDRYKPVETLLCKEDNIYSN